MRSLGFSPLSYHFVRGFSIYPNHHFRAEETVNGKSYQLDKDVHLYDSITQAYLAKRRIKKSEIRRINVFGFLRKEMRGTAAKIAILPELESCKEIYRSQKTAFLPQLYEKERLQRMWDKEEFDSQYIMSCNFEPHFKPMMDAILQKIVLNG
jgi:hypothetical protein